MKRFLLFTVAAATLVFSACNSKNKPEQNGTVVEEESIIFVNDSTTAAPQTFIFEGTSPMDGNALADVILAVSTVNLNSDGTYSITTDYIDEGIATQNDNGDAMILVGMNDSTASIIELVSANYDTPSITFMMTEDSSLVKVDSVGNPASNNPGHKLNLMK